MHRSLGEDRQAGARTRSEWHRDTRAEGRLGAHLGSRLGEGRHIWRGSMRAAGEGGLRGPDGVSGACEACEACRTCRTDATALMACSSCP